MTNAPIRLRVTDELGFAKTASDGHSLIQRGLGRQWLLLGLGPDPAALAASLPALTVSGGKVVNVCSGPAASLAASMPEDAEVFYLECPAFAQQAGADWRAAIPESWVPLASFAPHAGAHVILYQGGLRLFPSFWAPVLAALALPEILPAGTGLTSQTPAGAPGRPLENIASPGVQGQLPANAASPGAPGRPRANVVPSGAPGQPQGRQAPPGGQGQFQTSQTLLASAQPVPGSRGHSLAKTALLPAGKDKLLVRELTAALTAEGYQILSPAGDGLAAMLRQGKPDLFISVNFHGLDDYGQDFALLERAGVPVAVWCVDNPFHALSGLKSPFWRKTQIFVTDDWYIPVLKEHGAERVHHLPLAAGPGFFQARADAPELADKLLFVGRSAFPGRDGFFAGLNPPADAWAEALAMLRRGERPDFGWWRARLGVGRLWPGKDVRLAGVGAEESGRVWRAMVLAEAAGAAGNGRTEAVGSFGAGSAGTVGSGRADTARAADNGKVASLAGKASSAGVGRLIVYGDPAWRELVEAWAARAGEGDSGNPSGSGGASSHVVPDVSFELRPPVDYYGPLAGMYASARMTLGATSPLLPHGLTQRHFDVWAAGGLLLTDATPGLRLFPDDLAEPVTYRQASELRGVIARLEADPALARDLRQAWRGLISSGHTYAHRVSTILERVKA